MVYGVMVVWLDGFMIVWFLGFMVLGFLGFKISKKSMSCFQEDIDPISMILKILLRGCSSLFGARFCPNLVQTFDQMDFRNCEIYRNIVLEMFPRFSYMF